MTVEEITIPAELLNAINNERIRLGGHMVQLTDEQIVMIAIRWQLEHPFVPVCTVYSGSSI